MTRFTCIVLAVYFLFANTLRAQDEEKQKAMEIYGFIMTDVGHDFNQIDPDWFDVVRPTKLPAFENQFGADGNTYFSVRQTRLGFKNYFPSCLGDVKTIFEFEMFGTGVDAGQTTFRLRHAYAEVGHFGAGQYWSAFMDIDVFPNTLEYWGPNGMVFYRNVQVRYMPIMCENQNLTIAIERPGASADQGAYRDRIQLERISPRFPYPDLTAHYRYTGKKWGYVQLAGILRSIQWRDLHSDTFDLSGSAFGWGLNLSTNIKFGKEDRVVFKGQVVYGVGIENYMNDAPVDIGVSNNYGNLRRPILGDPLPVLGVVAFFDINWNCKFTSSVGYSTVQIDNTDAQLDDAFHSGQYGIVNLLVHPDKNIMYGIEGQWGERENFRDHWHSSIWKIQASFKFNFDQVFYREKTQD